MPLTLTVKPSSKVKRALKKGKTDPPHGDADLQVLARRHSDRQVFHETVKPPKKHKKHKKH